MASPNKQSNKRIVIIAAVALIGIGLLGLSGILYFIWANQTPKTAALPPTATPYPPAFTSTPTPTPTPTNTPEPTFTGTLVVGSDRQENISPGFTATPTPTRFPFPTPYPTHYSGPIPLRILQTPNSIRILQTADPNITPIPPPISQNANLTPLPPTTTPTANASLLAQFSKVTRGRRLWRSIDERFMVWTWFVLLLLATGGGLIYFGWGEDKVPLSPPRTALALVVLITYLISYSSFSGGILLTLTLLLFLMEVIVLLPLRQRWPSIWVTFSLAAPVMLCTLAIRAGLNDSFGSGVTLLTLPLLLCFLAIVVFFIGRHWPPIWAAFSLAVVMPILLCGVGISAYIGVGNPNQEFIFSPSLIGSLPLAAVAFLTASLLLALLVGRPITFHIGRQLKSETTNLVTLEFWRLLLIRLRVWIRIELGRPPRAYLTLILWLAVAVTLGEVLSSNSSFFFRALGIINSDDVSLRPIHSLTLSTFSGFTLPLSLMVATVHWLMTESPTITRIRQASILGGVTLLAIILYFIPLNFFFVPQLLGLPLPEAILPLGPLAWSVLALIITFTLAATRGHHFSFIWQAITVGATAGIILIIVLAYPVYTLTYTAFVSDSVFTGPQFEAATTLSILLGIVLSLTIGPLVVRWSQPQRRTKRLAAGAIAGAIAGVFLFGGLGSAATGLAAQEPLYGVALSRIGYSTGEWTLKLAIALNANLPATYAIFWVLGGLGACLGGITALLPLFQQTPIEKRPETPALWSLTILIVTFSLLILAIVNIAILLLLGPAIQNIFNLFGFTSSWRPEWSTVAGGVQPWLLFLITQAIGLYLLYRASTRMTLYRPAISLTFINGMLNLFILPLIMYAMNQALFTQFWGIISMLTMMIMGLEMILIAWQMWQPAQAEHSTQLPTPGYTAWITGGALGGLLTAVFIHGSTAGYLNMALGTISMIPELLEESAPSSGLAWIDQILPPLFITQFAAFLVTFIGFTVGGAIFGIFTKWAYGLSQLIPQTFALARDSLWSKTEVGLAALRQHRFVWPLTVLGGSVTVAVMIWLIQGGIFFPILILPAMIILLLPEQRLLLWTIAVPILTIISGLVVWTWTPWLTFGFYIPYFFYLIILLALTQRHRFEQTPWPHLWPTLTFFAWSGLVVMMASLLGGETLALFIFAVATLFGLIQWQWVERFSWPVLIIAFGLTAMGLAATPYSASSTRPWWSNLPSWWPLFGIAAGISYRALVIYTPTSTRLTGLLGIPVLMLGMIFSIFPQQVTQGGINRYDDSSEQWETFAMENSALGGQLNYRLFGDSQGRLWFSGGTGLVVGRTTTGWRSYTPSDADLSRAERSQFIGEPSYMAEDRYGRLWVATNTMLGQFDPDKAEDNLDLLLGKDQPDTASVSPSASIPDCTVRVWDNQGNFILSLAGHTDRVTSAVFSPDGTQIVTVSRDTVQLWDTSGHSIATLDTYGRDFISADFSPDGTKIAIINPETVLYWDRKGEYIGVSEVPQGITSADFSPQGKQLFITNRDNVGFLSSGAWTTEAVRDITSAHFSPDESRVVTLNSDGTVYLWSKNFEFITALEGHTDRITSVSFNPDGTRIITVSDDDTVRLWDTNGQLLITLSDHTADVTAANFSPDGAWIVTIGNDDTVRLWDAEGNLITLLQGTFNDLTLASFSPDSAQIVTVDNNGGVRLWDTEGRLLVTFGGKQANAASFSPAGTQLLITECAPGDSHVIPIRALSQAQLNTSLTDMAIDQTDNLWLATAGEGVLRLSGSETENMRWKFFTVSASNLPSDNVSVIYPAQSGILWFGTERGLSRFDGHTWDRVTIPGLLGDTSVNTILEDSQHRLWVGTNQGGYWGDGQNWRIFDDLPGWPDDVSVEVLLEDSRREIWAGTPSGALRFDGQRWARIIPDTRITEFVEGPPGIIWIGTEEGLTRYDLESRDRETFNSENSGMAADWVRDLYIDQDGGLWISTFTSNLELLWPWESSSTFLWGSAGIIFIFMGYLFVNTYRGYAKTPETRARRLERKIRANPNRLYPTIYAQLTKVQDAPLVLSLLAGYIKQRGDQTDAEVIKTIGALPVATDLDEALKQIVAALKASRTRSQAKPLHSLYTILGMVLAARKVADIANLELIVNPGQETGSVVLHVNNKSTEALPSFLPQSHTEAWYTLERVFTTLRKYREVDAASDRLSYLAEALAAVEAAKTATQQVAPPEGIVLAAVANRWRAAVTDEINAVSGRAELRLELRTHQVRRTDTVTVGLQLYNDGRAVAEHVVIALQPGQGFSLVGETLIELERLSSGHSVPLEFQIMPLEAETIRIVCHVTWDDRIATDNRIEFANLVHFLEVSEAFRRIPNPYIVGHPVKSSQMFHGREDVFRYIEDNLSGPVKDRTLILHGQRRTGKTSILYQLLQGRLGQEFIVALIDMQELAFLINSTADFLSELAYQLTRCTGKAGVSIEEPDPIAFEAAPTRVFNRFLDTLEDSLAGRRIIVMFDEFELIEDKIVEGKLDASLLGYFRSLMQHRDPLVFIFTGTHRLEEMSQNYWSILFNIALYRRVSFLSKTEATRLIRQPVAGNLEIDELAIEKIVNLTSGHPYFTQLICWALVNHCNAQERSYATINDVNAAVQEILTTGEAHFAYIWQQASRGEWLALAGLAHTLQPGKTWARPSEILTTLTTGGDTQTQRATLLDILDRLVAQEVLEIASEGALRYRFQIELLQLWVKTTKSVAALVERE